MSTSTPSSTADQDSGSATPDTSLKLERIIPAPREQVYALWTNTDRAKEWWGPEGCETLELVCDPHPGGPFMWTLRTPEGETMTARGIFREVVPGRKVVYTWQWEDDPQWQEIESLITVEFLDHETDSTEVRLTHEGLPSKESRDNHVGGWGSALEKLAHLVEP